MIDGRAEPFRASVFICPECDTLHRLDGEDFYIRAGAEYEEVCENCESTILVTIKE